jgi:hypothetical protein
MRLVSCCFSATLAVGLTLFAFPLTAQQVEAARAGASELPVAPQPQMEIAALEPLAQQTTPSQPATGTSSSQAVATTSDDQHQKAEAQLKEEEKQRVLGVLPSFNVSYRSDAVSLTAKQKLSLAFHSSIDPVTFGAAFLVAGYHEGMHDDVGFPWGIKGYGERSGAAYLDAFDGTMIGNGILPALLHQDPRYFRLGHGATTHRLLYALATNVVCKHDNTGKWEPNYSNVTGNIASGALSNLYYPSSGSGIGQTFTNGFIVTAEGGFGSIFQEFWPDISRHFLHKDPTHGLDAQARAADRDSKKN